MAVGGIDVGCAHPVREHEEVAGEPEPVVAVGRGQGIDRHVQADEVRAPGSRRRPRISTRRSGPGRRSEGEMAWTV